MLPGWSARAYFTSAAKTVFQSRELTAALEATPPKPDSRPVTIADAITSVTFLGLPVVTHNDSNECSGEVGWVVKVSVTNLARQWWRISASLRAAHVLLVFCSLPTFLLAQTSSSDSPIPILSGSAGYFNFVTAGQNQFDAQINPVLLLPLGDRWLVESRAEFEGAFQRLPDGGPYGGPVSKNLDYAQVDYIANPYLTVTVGRFLTPFGIFNERLYPIWIRSLQQDPLILPLSAESSDGAMLRGGFPVNAQANLNYAVYVSAISTVHNNLQSERNVGGRVGVFLPGSRFEVGASWQKLLQDGRTNAFGFYSAWQPQRLPLNMHGEYARSNQGSGYWVDGAYRLSQFQRKAVRRIELAGRAEQFFSNQIGSAEAEALGLPGANTREGEFGLNYYLHDGLKAVASYGRQFSSNGNFNLWTFGIAYRFMVPLGRAQ